MGTLTNLPTLIAQLRNRILTAFPDIRIGSSELISSGWDNYILLVNGRIAFKFPRTESHSRYLEKEINVLQEIRDCPVRVPDYRYISGSGSGMFVGYDFISGDPMNSVNSLSDTMIMQLTEFLNYLRSVSPSLIGKGKLRDSDYSALRDKYRQMYRDVIRNYTGILDQHILNMIEAEFRKYLAHPSPGFETSLAHGDLYRGNVVIDSKIGRVNGVIDWGDCSIGDPAVDFAAIAVDFPADQVLQILSGYEGPQDNSFMERIEFYWKMEPFYSIGHFIELKDEEMRDSSIEALRKRLNSTLF